MDDESWLCVSQILETALRESHKNQPGYKLAALACLGNILESYERDYFRQVWEIVTPHLSKVSHLALRWAELSCITVVGGGDFCFNA